jgi:hypothetical protein
MIYVVMQLFLVSLFVCCSSEHSDEPSGSLKGIKFL